MRLLLDLSEGEEAPVTADVIAIIAKRVSAEKRNISVADRLDDLGIDSFAAVEMIFDLEEKFDIQISYNSNDPAPEFETVKRLAPIGAALSRIWTPPGVDERFIVTSVEEAPTCSCHFVVPRSGRCLPT